MLRAVCEKPNCCSTRWRRDLPSRGALGGLADELADALDEAGRIAGRRGFLAGEAGCFASGQRDDRAFGRHRLEHARRSAGGEFGDVNVGDLEESGHVFATAGIADALADTGGFEFSLLPAQVRFAHQQVDRLRVRGGWRSSSRQTIRKSCDPGPSLRLRERLRFRECHRPCDSGRRHRFHRGLRLPRSHRASMFRLAQKSRSALSRALSV